jgi:3-deoxy-7-phosphoheptulonate synthase
MPCVGVFFRKEEAMVIILKDNPNQKQLDHLVVWLKSMGMEIHESKGHNTSIIGLIGDTSTIDIDLIRALDIVKDVKRIQEPYKNANRKFHPEDTVVEVGSSKIGGGNFQIIAGPCSVESMEQICSIAKSVKECGIGILRGGAFKPRTSPYAFQGMREEGIRMLLEAKKVTGLSIVTEIMDLSHLHLFEEVDMIQVGARNMQNFELLKELGKLDKPVLLKRGLSNTLQELMMSAEYIMAGGNNNVVLCERGIRTFETATRNTLDLSVVPLLKSKTHLPVIVDPSHGTGIAELVTPMSMAAAAAGSDGLLIEVHNDPPHALCDGQQSLTPEAFKKLVEKVSLILPNAYKQGVI